MESSTNISDGLSRRGLDDPWTKWQPRDLVHEDEIILVPWPNADAAKAPLDALNMFFPA